MDSVCESAPAGLGLPVSGINLSYSNSGTIGAEGADVLISLADGHRATADYVRILRDELPRRFPGTTFSFLPADIVSHILNFGSPAPLDLQVVGPNLANATANAPLSTATASRYRELAGRGIVSKQTDEEKSGDAAAKQAMRESARANVARLEALMAFKSLVAPFDGIVTTRSIDVGALINAGGTTGSALYQVADISRVRVYLRVPQAFVGDLKEGTRASLRVSQFPGQSFEASLVGISKSIAQESCTALVQLQAENPQQNLWPGTYAEVNFQIPPNPEALRVPATALMFGEHGVKVATVDGNDTVALKPVQLGRDIGTDIELLSGLAPSDRLTDSPLEILSTGDKVRVVKGPSTEPKLVDAATR